MRPVRRSPAAKLRSALSFPMAFAMALAGCASAPVAKVSLGEAGLEPSRATSAAFAETPLDRSTEALLDAIERETGERPVFEGDSIALSAPLDSTPSASPAEHGTPDHGTADGKGWITERRVLAMDVLRATSDSRVSRTSLARARSALRWDVALAAHWSEVDGDLVNQALARADAWLGPPPGAASESIALSWGDAFEWPISPVRITSKYGVRQDPLGEGVRLHTGLDLWGTLGQPVYSAAQGVVIYAGQRGSYGLHVEIRHPGGFTTRYAHLSAAYVAPGDRVQSGAPIGRVGMTGRATGPHLHFEIWHDGLPMDPLVALPDVPHGSRPLATN